MIEKLGIDIKLDPDKVYRFREAVNSSPTLSHDNDCIALYNLSCAVMDRLDSSVRYLNTHWDYPDTEEDFLCFMMFACILNDGINKIFEKAKGDKPKCDNQKSYFKDCCMREPLNISEENCPTDGKFFEHIRSLIFAHPYDTNRNKTFNNLFGEQVSPWVVVNKSYSTLYQFSEPIGVRLYSENKKAGNDIHNIMFSFMDLKGFLQEKYLALDTITQWIAEESEKTYSNWKKDRINRDQPPCDILRDVCKILEKRYESITGIKRIIEYLECPLSDDRNQTYVNEYRDYVEKMIPKLCDYVESLDSTGQYEIERSTETFYPTGLHQMAGYQIEKIYTYLQGHRSYVLESSNEEWGLIQAEAFYKEFAKKWVCMSVYEMDYVEIRLLITVALFMECKEQGRLSVR